MPKRQLVVLVAMKMDFHSWASGLHRGYCVAYYAYPGEVLGPCLEEDAAA